jgi:hypothetical protein
MIREMPRSRRAKGEYLQEIRALVKNLLTDPRFEISIRSDAEWWNFIGSISPRGTSLHPRVQEFFGGAFSYIQGLLTDAGIVPSTFFIGGREVFRWRDAITGRFVSVREVMFTLYDIFLDL